MMLKMYLRSDHAQTVYHEQLSALFQEHHERLVRYINGRLQTRSEAEEIAQDAYIRLLERGPEPPIDDLMKLLYVTARNLTTDRLRQRSRRNEEALAIWDKDSSINPEQILSAREQLWRLQSLLTALPPKCRNAFLRYKIQGHSYAEIAAEMQLTESMVRKYVLRAVVYCASHLETKDKNK